MIQMAITVVGIALAAWFDYKTRRIPNGFTFSLILMGLILNSYFSGIEGLKLSFFGLGLAILILYIPFAVGGMGGGDVKLLAGIGTLLGPALFFKIFLASAVFGGIFSFIAMWKAKAVRNTFYGVMNRSFCFLTTKGITQEVSTEKTLGIPYAYAIACGTLFVLFVLKGG